MGSIGMRLRFPAPGQRYREETLEEILSQSPGDRRTLLDEMYTSFKELTTDQLTFFSCFVR